MVAFRIIDLVQERTTSKRVQLRDSGYRSNGRAEVLRLRDSGCLNGLVTEVGSCFTPAET